MRAPVSLAVVATALALAPGPAPAGAAPPGEVVRVEHYDPTTMPVRGPADALVTVEVFFAPSVNTQRIAAFRLIEQLQQRHPTGVRVIYRVVRRGAQPPGPLLPTLALEAYAQGRFFEFVALVQAQRQSLTREQMLELGRRVGLDVPRAGRAISDDRYRDILDANERRLERLHGTTSPVVFFNSKPAPRSLSAMGETEYEAAYADALERARDLVDRGVARGDLSAVFDARALQAEAPLVITSGPTDADELAAEAFDHALASPPLAVAGMPTFGDGGARDALPVLLVCRPNDPTCLNAMRFARRIADTYRGEVRIVWAPFFDVTRDDAVALTLLADAALCAERIGSSPDDLDASPGWAWMTETYLQLVRAPPRSGSPEALIDSVAARLGVDGRQLSACRARLASTSLAWIAQARRAGVTSAPAVVIGGRIYPGLWDASLVQQLVEVELAPGVLGRCATTGCE